MFVGSKKRHRNLWVEFWALFVRELKAVKRDPRLAIGRIVSTMIVMALCACVFMYSANQSLPTYFLGSHFGSFVFPMFSSCFATMIPTLLVILDSRHVFVRERAVDTYGSFPYAMARVIPELIINFIVSVITVLLMYWSAQWDGNFMMIVLAFFLLLESCVSYAYLLGFAVNNASVAVGLVALLLVPQLLFMGTFVRINALPVWLAWISWICNITYALRLIIVIEFSDPSKCGSLVTCAQWKALQDANYAWPGNLWLYIFMLCVFFVLFRVISFLIIRGKIHRAKRFGEL